MLSVLVYGDSLSWGIVPGERRRLPFDQRWPGVMERGLAADRLSVRVVENCLNGRRTVWDDPFKPGRNGLQGVEQVMEINSPLDLVVLCLGTNDMFINGLSQTAPSNSSWLQRQIGGSPVSPPLLSRPSRTCSGIRWG